MMPVVGKDYSLEDVKHNLITPPDFKTWLKSKWYQHFFYNYACTIVRDGLIKKCIKGRKHPWDILTPSNEAYVLTVMINSYWKWRVGEDYYFDQTIKSTKYKREEFGEAGKRTYEHQEPTDDEIEDENEEDLCGSEEDDEEPTSIDAKFQAMRNKPNYIKLVGKCRRRNTEPLLPNTLWTPKLGKRKDFKDGWHRTGVAFYHGIKTFITEQRIDHEHKSLANSELKRYLKKMNLLQDSDDPDDELISEKDRQTLEQRNQGTSLPFLMENECKNYTEDEYDGDPDENQEDSDDFSTFSSFDRDDQFQVL